MEKEREDKILEAIHRQNKLMVEQFSTIHKKLGGHNDRFDRIEMAVLEIGGDIKAIKAKQEVTDKKIDIAVTNHEQRIRKLEVKTGI